MVVPVKSAADRPRSPRRGPARDAQCPHEQRSGARGEALWTPVGDRATGGHAAGLSAAPQGRALQLDPVRTMDDAIEDRVGQGGKADHLMPAVDRRLRRQTKHRIEGIGWGGSPSSTTRATRSPSATSSGSRSATRLEGQFLAFWKAGKHRNPAQLKIRRSAWFSLRSPPRCTLRR
jgi:hypothetical protein